MYLYLIFTLKHKTSMQYINLLKSIICVIIVSISLSSCVTATKVLSNNDKPLFSNQKENAIVSSYSLRKILNRDE